MLVNLNNLNLSRKGMILVLVPLVSSFVFIAVLTFLLVEAEREGERQARQKEALAAGERVVQTMFQAMSAMGGYGLTRHRAFHERFKEMAQRMPVELAEAKRLAATPQQHEALSRLETTQKRLITMGENAADAIASENPGSLPAVLEMRAELKMLLTDYVSEGLKFIDLERLRVAREPDSAKMWRNYVKTFLVFGLVANVLLSLWLAGFFTRTISGRLEVMNDNVRRLADKESLNAIVEGNDEIAALDSSFHDMAEKLTEAERHRLEVERMKQEFLAMVSHDLSTPLSSVQGILGLVSAKAYGELSDRGHQLVKMAEVQVDRLNRLVSDLLLIEKIESGTFDLNREQIDFAAVASTAVSAVETQAAAKKISIDTVIGSSRFEADEFRLVQVLVNLLANAIKFSPEGGTITVTSEDLDDFVEVRVVDEGRGVPPESREDIFNKFRQVEPDDARQKGGTGLGLAICKQIIETHGGAIGVSCENGRGSTFWFRIPREVVLEAVALDKAE